MKLENAELKHIEKGSCISHTFGLRDIFVVVFQKIYLLLFFFDLK